MKSNLQPESDSLDTVDAELLAEHSRIELAVKSALTRFFDEKIDSLVTKRPFSESVALITDVNLAMEPYSRQAVTEAFPGSLDPLDPLGRKFGLIHTALVQRALRQLIRNAAIASIVKAFSDV